MKTYPHKPDLEDLRDSRERCLKRDAKMTADMEKQVAARNERWMEVAADNAIDLASLAYGFENPPGDVLFHLREATRHWAKAMEFGLPISPYPFLLYLAAGLIVDDTALLNTLSGFKRARFTNPEEDAPEAGYLLAEAEAALVGGRTAEAVERIDKAMQAAPKMNRFQKAEFGDLIQMVHAILRKDQAAWSAAAAARLKSYAKTYSHPDYQQFPEGLLDVRALGLARQAREAGLSVSDSVYVPTSLLGK